MTAKLDYRGKVVFDADTDTETINGISAYEVAREHAIYREVLCAIYRGELNGYCKKYGITYDDVYTTQIEAVVDFVQEYTYIGIDTDEPVALDEATT